MAASSVSPLLLARGHRVEQIPEVPLVIDSAAFKTLAKTKAAIALLKGIGAGPELTKVSESRKIRAGHGKLRGRRYRQRRGPLVVYDPEIDGQDSLKAFRNIPGVELASVHALNLLQLAPGGHMGRFVIWTSTAFAALDKIYDSKKDFALPSNIISNSDITRIINSSEVQSAARAPRGVAKTKRAVAQKKNPLHNKQVMLRMNPYAAAFSKAKLGQEKLPSGKPERSGETFQNILVGN